MKGFLYISTTAFLLMIFAAAANACCVEKYTTVGGFHGLYEIRQEAVRFIAEENRKPGPKWSVLEPNLKVLVPTCVVPLKARWLPKSYGASGQNVVVHCSKSELVTKDMKEWDVFVPVFRPQDRKSNLSR